MSSIYWPPEIVRRPRPLVSLTGLYIDDNPVHKSVWEGFTKIRRQDRAPLNIKLFPVKHEYTKSKNKRVSYEWYVPKGILKCQWMIKHMEDVPSLVVVFFDMDWDDIQWREKINECAALVNIVKKNVQGRYTKIVVVLIQKRVLMPGEDSHTEHKAQVLCQVCDLSGNRNLFMLPTTESLFGYITRLEKEFQDLANNYYQSLIKKVKSHRDSLNKTTHLLLFIRHHFKIAFYQEFRQEHALALKNYKQAYSFLRELRLLETHLLEIKTVAGYINYKICCLSFQNNASDAISQFRTHIDIFKGVCGNPELAFEHEAWISKQFEVMADLFRDAIRQGLMAITTQHPGLYYEEAALHAVARKRFSRRTLLSSARCMSRHYLVTDESYISSSSDGAGCGVAEDTEGLLAEPLEFYGQRPWRQAKQSIEIGDPAKEKEAIAVLRGLESQVDHSQIIIPLLKNAMDHYQKYKANRMKLMSCVLMGEEYMSCLDYHQALKCFYKVISEYRSERWHSLLLPALLNSLKCTFMTAQMPDYVSICLELIRQESHLNGEEKLRIQNNLVQVLNNQAPESENCFSKSSEDEDAQKLWLNNISSFQYDVQHRDNFIINMDGIESSVDCRIVFPTEKFPVNEPLQFSVFLRSTCAVPLRIENVEVLFTDERYNSRYKTVTDRDSVDMVLDGGSDAITEVRFSLVPLAEDVIQTIKVEKLRLQLGRLERFGHSLLTWSVSADDFHRQAYRPAQPTTFKVTPGTSGLQPEWSSITNIPFLELIGRKSKFELGLTHSDPVLVNEHHPIQVRISNGEAQPVNSITVTLSMEEPSTTSHKVRFLSLGSLSNPDLVSVKTGPNKKIELRISRLEPGQEITETIVITATETGKIRVCLEVGYKIRIDIDKYTNVCQCTKSEIINTTAIHPFEVMSKLLSPFMIPMKEVIVAEPFLLQITSSNVSSVTLEIVKTEIVLSEELLLLEDDDSMAEDRLTNEQLNSLDAACEVFMLQVDRSNADSDKNYTPMGKYQIHWRRIQESDEETASSAVTTSPITVTTVPLPDCGLDSAPVTVDMEMASHGVCKTPFTLTYTLRNRTIFPIEVEAQLDMSDNFMYSGSKLVQLRLLPGCAYPLRFRLLPLLSGLQELPRFRVRLRGTTASGTGATTEPPRIDEAGLPDGSALRLLEQNLLARLPGFVFVKPTVSATGVL